MTKEEKNIRQRENINELLNLFSGNKKYYYVTEELEDKLKRIFKNILDVEIEELGKDIKNEIKIGIVTLDGIFPQDADFYDIRSLDDNGNIKKSSIEININVAPLSSRLSYAPYEEVQKYCTYLVKYLFHEIRHLEQEIIMEKNESSNKTLAITKDNVLFAEQRQIYHDNYSSFAIEKDAQIYGMRRLSEIINSKIEQDFIQEKLIYETGKYEYNNEDIFRDDIADLLIDKMICEDKNEKLLKLYPPLTKIYNFDCTRKNICELINCLNSEKEEIIKSETKNNKRLIKDTEEMYFELIYKQLNTIDNTQINELNSIYGTEKIDMLFNKMIGYFNQEKLRKLNLISYSKTMTSKKEDVLTNLEEEIEDYYEEKKKVINNFISKNSNNKDFHKLVKKKSL